jgi:hypothetical protein
VKLLCLVKHQWEKRPAEHGGYGMGLETFEMQQCKRCFRWRDRVKGLRPDVRTRYPWFFTDRPAVDWRTLSLHELADLPCIIDCRDGAVESERDAAIQRARRQIAQGKIREQAFIAEKTT